MFAANLWRGNRCKLDVNPADKNVVTMGTTSGRPPRHTVLVVTGRPALNGQFADFCNLPFLTGGWARFRDDRGARSAGIRRQVEPHHDPEIGTQRRPFPL